MADDSGTQSQVDALASPLQLPCGLRLKNRLVKAAMSDCLGDGRGDATDAQRELYRRWAHGGAALSMIGEVQVDPAYPEKPGNLVLTDRSDEARLRRLAEAGEQHGAHIWPQLGCAGALAHPPISHPAGPSALHRDGLRCDALPGSAVEALPERYARAARHAERLGFTGVQVHAGHGWLLSQFLSPLFNHRTDRYGGPIEARARILLDIVRQIRAEVSPTFALGVKLNTSDQLEGGLTEDDALYVIALLGREAVDLIDLSGGTYFPGAPSSSDRHTRGPYFVDFARRARAVTDVPLMPTGGFKTRHEAAQAVDGGAADLVGLARAMVLDPDLPAKWLRGQDADPTFPRFDEPPEGGITAWYTMRLSALAEHEEERYDPTMSEAVEAYESRDAWRVPTWNHAFGSR